MARRRPAEEQRADRLKVFITGASSGIGLALAKHYARHGAILGLVARRRELLESLKQQLQLEPMAECALYTVDVRDAEAMANAAETFMTRYGVPDIVIANAGVSRGTLTELQEDIPAFKAVFEINLLGMVHTFQPFIGAMRRLGHGRLAGIASVAGIRGLPGAGAYSASKAAAITYLESLRLEMRVSGITVTTIAPGYIRTPMTDINAYAMPFLMDADVAARKFAQAIARGRRFVIVPWQMGLVARLMRLLPAIVWDYLAGGAPHKSRINIERRN